MNIQHQCASCNYYEQQGHNFCRMCGCNFKHGTVRNAPIAASYSLNENYCGYCGGEKNNCECRS